LKKSFEKAQSRNYYLGAKIVRGAYMDKERQRAESLNTSSPIHESKAEVDRDFDSAIEFCVEHYNRISSCNASHNTTSAMTMAKMITDKLIPRNHSHLNFCQLLGMSDNITFNLAHHGFNVAKYVPYGPIQEVIPFLIRRAQENSSITGEVGRELAMIKDEVDRRGLNKNKNKRQP